MTLRRSAVIGIAVLLLVCLFSDPSHSQTNAATPKTFSLEDALNYALQNYPAVRASLEQVNAAHAGITLARAQYLPSLKRRLSGQPRHTKPGAGDLAADSDHSDCGRADRRFISGQSYWGSQAAALVFLGAIRLRTSTLGNVAQAKSAEDKSNADLAVTRLQVAAAVGNYFLTALATQQAVAAAQANVDRWQVFNQSIHTLVDNTLRPGADASRADAQLAIARTQLYQAQQAEQAALATLASLMGAAGNEIRLIAGKLLDLPPVDSLPSVAPASQSPGPRSNGRCTSRRRRRKRS